MQKSVPKICIVLFQLFSIKILVLQHDASKY